MRTSIAVLSIALIAPACKKHDQGPLLLCSNEVAGNEASEVKTQEVPADVWFAIVLKQYNSRTKEVARPTRDCTGRPLVVEDEEVALCITPENAPVPLPSRALDEETDLQITPLEEKGQALVWIRTEYYENGDALGPVAIVQWTKRGVAVRAIGPLYANANKARMRLEKMGDSQVLVVESNVCDPDVPTKCTRVMRLLPLVGYRFEERPLIDKDTRECLGPATFELHKKHEVQRDDGMLRTFELSRSFEFSEGSVKLTEQVVIKDMDPKSPDDPPNVFRNAHIERPMTLIENGVATGEGLWERMLSEHGSVNLKPKAAPTETEAEEG